MRRPGAQGTHDLVCLKRELSRPSAAHVGRSCQALYWCHRTGVNSWREFETRMWDPEGSANKGDR